MLLPKRVKIVEVGPRDGLQNETTIVPTQVKIELIDRLSQTGLAAIEGGSFVSPKWMPQMADSLQVMHGIKRHPGVCYPVLVPNLQGLQSALQADIDEISIFASASESFSRKNINCSIAQSLDRFAEVCNEAKKHNLRVRAYISCTLGCPYEGTVDPHNVAWLASRLVELGCYEISLGDTIGVATPGKAQEMVDCVAGKVQHERLAAHFHDTYGQALANILAVMERGITVIDSSVSGLGGCPFAPGASGNVATEDLLYMLKGLGIETGVDLQAVAEAGRFITGFLGRPSGSRVAHALAGQLEKSRTCA
ncbi:MAG: hydroxymethylglutaryl-CoA lyase [Desulfuromonadales bacterium]|nr:hydroxymethylglutaryl-CoA lyase [Desulfuromonadales bacterium]